MPAQVPLLVLNGDPLPAELLMHWETFRLLSIALMVAASQLPPESSLRPHTYQTLLGVLYSTGIRIGEASALNLEHFHSQEQMLYIAEGNFRKAHQKIRQTTSYSSAPTA